MWKKPNAKCWGLAGKCQLKTAAQKHIVWAENAWIWVSYNCHMQRKEQGIIKFNADMKQLVLFLFQMFVLTQYGQGVCSLSHRWGIQEPLLQWDQHSEAGCLGLTLPSSLLSVFCVSSSPAFSVALPSLFRWHVQEMWSAMRWQGRDAALHQVEWIFLPLSHMSSEVRTAHKGNMAF